MDDPYTKKAKAENYEARSVYKLQEIEKKERIFSGVKTVLDLGAAPGSWTQFCLEKLSPSAKIIAIDLSEMRVADARLEFHRQSIFDWQPDPHLKIDLILSDMAPKTSGIHDRDVWLSLELCERALEIAKQVGHANSKLVVKIFMGSGFEDFQKKMKATFTAVKLYKPESTRKHSREIYSIGKGLRNIEK